MAGTPTGDSATFFILQYLADNIILYIFATGGSI